MSRLARKVYKDYNKGMRIRVICNKYKMSIDTFYKLVIPLGYEKEKPRKRKSESHPRITKTWTVKNRLLQSLVLTTPKHTYEVAKDLNVSSRSLSAWIYEGVIPTKENRIKLEDYFGYPEHILFYEIDKDRHPYK